MFVPDSLRELLATGPLAHLVTLDPDGSPRVTLQWAGFDRDEIVMATFFNLEQAKLRNIRRDPRVTLSFEARERAELLHPYAVVHGRARISEGGALAVMDRLAEFYLGPGATYPMREIPDGVVIRVTVEKVSGIGPWAEPRAR